jgi:hypothetical protein
MFTQLISTICLSRFLTVNFKFVLQAHFSSPTFVTFSAFSRINK